MADGIQVPPTSIDVQGQGASVPTEPSWKLPFIQPQQEQQQQAPSGRDPKQDAAQNILGRMMMQREHMPRMQQSQYTAPWLFGAIYGAIRHHKIAQVRDYVVKWNTLMNSRDSVQEMMSQSPQFQQMSPQQQQQAISEAWSKTPEFQEILVNDPKAAKDMFKALHFDFLNPKEQPAQQALVKALQLQKMGKEVKNLAQLKQQYASQMAQRMPLQPERMAPETMGKAALIPGQIGEANARIAQAASAVRLNDANAALIDAQRRLLETGAGQDWLPVIRDGEVVGVQNSMTKQSFGADATDKMPPAAKKALQAGAEAVDRHNQKEIDKESRMFKNHLAALQQSFQNSLNAKDYADALKQVSTAKAALDGSKMGVRIMDRLASAAKGGNQQAMLAILSYHVQMTTGARIVAGSTPRISMYMYEEAQQTSPMLARIQARFGKDGYLSGVVLTPQQVDQMVELAHGLAAARQDTYNEIHSQYADTLSINRRQPGKPEKKPDVVVSW